MIKRAKREFQPNAAFVASRVMTFNGREYAPGEPIDSTGVPIARLRQLFEARRIDHALSGSQAIQSASVAPIPPSELGLDVASAEPLPASLKPPKRRG